MNTNLPVQAPVAAATRVPADSTPASRVAQPPPAAQGPPHSPPSATDVHRDILLGCLVGFIGGAAFGAFASWWYSVDSLPTALILTLHAGFAGVAMGAWLWPTLHTP